MGNYPLKSYTTIEVILIILLIAVWLAVALPRFGAGDILNKSRLKTAAYNIASDIRYARSQAITAADTYAIQFNFTQNTYQIIGPNNEVLATKNIPSGVTGSGTTQYNFTSLGEANWTVGTGEINFSIISGGQYRITVTRATGTARIEKLP